MKRARIRAMKSLKQILIAPALMIAVIGASGPVLAQQQPVDTRQYAVNPPQSAVGVPQLPSQRAYPLDQWGRQVLPRGRGAIVIPKNNKHPQLRFQPHGTSYLGLRRLYQGKYGLHTDEYGRTYYGKKR